MTGVPPAPPATQMTCDPDPPKRGQDVKICYDFKEGDPSPITLEIEFDTPEGIQPHTEQVSREDPCVTLPVPSDATGMLVVDQSGTSGSLARNIAS